MKALGRYILDCMKGSFEPYFTVQEDRKYENARKMPNLRGRPERHVYQRKIYDGAIISPCRSSYLKTTIYLCLQEGSYPYSGDSNLPLSGFPRTLMTEELTQVSSASLRNLYILLTDGKRTTTQHSHPPKQRLLKRTRQPSPSPNSQDLIVYGKLF